MKTLCSFLAVFAFLFGATAFAQISDQIDGIGLYFDLDATEFCLEFPPAPPPAGELEAYLILTLPSNTSGIIGWQCRLDFTVPTGCVVWSYAYPTPAMNMLSPPIFAVSIFDPLPYQSAMHLMTMTLHVSCPGPWAFRVYPADFGTGKLDPPDRPLYHPADDPAQEISMFQVSGGEQYPVAVINGICDVIGSGPSTWGGVKRLFR